MQIRFLNSDKLNNFRMTIYWQEEMENKLEIIYF